MKLPFILTRPIITESSMRLAQTGVYTFEVAKNATKGQVRQAIETYFGVTVMGVHTLTRPGKSKRPGKRRTPIKAADTKKAIIKVKSGQTIALFDVKE